MYMNDGNKTKINLRNKSVFITGVAGFIGSNLAKRLLSTVEGVKVVGLDNMNHYYDVRLKEARLNELEQFDNFSFVKGNLADKAVIESIFEQYKPEIVVNLGAQAGVRYSITNPDAYVEANLIGFYTLDSNGRMILTILASVAEEESHSKSIIMNWSIDRRFSRGLFLTPALLGYDKDEEGNLVINPEEAQTVKVIYYLYLNGYSLTEIATLLMEYLRDPAIVIRKDSITFNTACITGLEDVVYVHVMFNNDLKRIVVRGCDENDKDALRWCVAKPDKRKSRKMSCKPFATLVYQKMGWDSECRYKMLGYRITFEGETLYVFDLLVPEIFHEGQRKKNAVDSQDNAASTKPVNSRKGFYLDDIVGTFGVPVEEHRKESEVKQMDGYVSMGILTGKIAPEAGKD